MRRVCTGMLLQYAQTVSWERLAGPCPGYEAEAVAAATEAKRVIEVADPPVEPSL